MVTCIYRHCRRSHAFSFSLYIKIFYIIFYIQGSFMIFAWMFLAIISIFIARYSRLLWKGWRIRGSDAWFQVCINNLLHLLFFLFCLYEVVSRVLYGAKIHISRLIATLCHAVRLVEVSDKQM